MEKETRIVVYDEELRIEAFRFKGIVRPFPNHFHDYYVIGFVESGERCLSCKNKEYNINQGHIIIFNPEDNHTCFQSDGGAFDYFGLNIDKNVMLDLAEEVTGKRELIGFSKNVIYNDEITCYLQKLHEMIMKGVSDLGKEENLLLLIFDLIQNYGQKFESCVPECPKEIEKACEFMRKHYSERISLKSICLYAGLSKSALLRAFIKLKGITPYRYLETIRINEAKEFLSKGIQPLETAIRTGFSDQSHFTNYFNSFIGVPPGAYRDMFFNMSKDGGHGI